MLRVIEAFHILQGRVPSFCGEVDYLAMLAFESGTQQFLEAAELRLAIGKNKAAGRSPKVFDLFDG